MKSMNTDVYNSDILPKNEENSLGGFMKLDHYYKGSLYYNSYYQHSLWISNFE